MFEQELITIRKNWLTITVGVIIGLLINKLFYVTLILVGGIVGVYYLRKYNVRIPLIDKVIK